MAMEWLIREHFGMNGMAENSFVLDTNAVIFLTTMLKLPDCIVAATAIALNAVLMTADKKLLGLSWPGLQTQQIF